MVDIDDIRLTIRQTTKLIYPFMNDATIHQWMSKGVFRPLIYVPPPAGPGRGCELDFADLVTVGVLHSLFSFGVRFNQMRLGSRDFPVDYVVFAEPKKETHRPSFKRATAQGEVDEQKGILLGRLIQAFLSKYNYEVLVHFAPHHATLDDRILQSIITFFPMSDQGTREGFLREVDNPYYMETGAVFISCYRWFNTVIVGLERHGLIKVK